MNFNETMLNTAMQAANHHTGFVESMQRMINAPGTDMEKMQAMLDIFEATRPYWPPMTRDNSITPDCKKGCAYCCHLNVDVLEQEIDLIWRNVSRYLTTEQVEAVKQQAEINYIAKKDLGYEDRIRTRQRCPFLGKDNLCMIYEDRPLACRGMYSGDVKACENGMQETDTQNMFWGAPFMISSDLATGAVIALSRKYKRLCSMTLEVGILRQFDNTIQRYDGV